MKAKIPTCTPRDIDWARLAAYLDGEGHITILRDSPNRCERVSPQHIVRVEISNTDPRLIHWCINTFCAGRCIKRPPVGTHKPVYQWRADGTMAEWILDGCMPHFIIKREQAQICLVLRETRKWHTTYAQAAHKRTPLVIVEQRDKLVEELKAVRRAVIPYENVA